ncbi:hypothetical protein HK100_002493 [Physocladia obscura]|uniref:Major facilitator superfamily (MFS) profile domain-containing protein n=1 Tax=Physocladia obscura TaxID=109957 RepID=A0AAD5XB17_9FUNG|nr:hypothetical protein HK100_002493 [Physocladia obscura]
MKTLMADDPGKITEFRSASLSPTNSNVNLNTFVTFKEEAFTVEDKVDTVAAITDSNFATPNSKDSTNPREWPRSKKWQAVVMAALYTFISPISSSMVAPALSEMAIELGLETDFMVDMTLSIFILAYAFGPLILAPLSEVYGRYKVLQGSLWFFIIFNLACGFAKNPVEIYVFRFLAGLGGSAPIAISGSVIADLFELSEMGTAMAYYSLGLTLGPAIGPIIGGAITQGANWHWLFYSISIAAAILGIFGIFLLPETFRPYLESRNQTAAALKNSNQISHQPEPNAANVIRIAVVRPFIMLGTQPIAQAIALLMAFVYGIMYLVLSTYSALFTSNYAEATFTSTLHYIALGLGFLAGNILAGRTVDFTSIYLQKRYNTEHMPEYRLPVCIPATIMLPIGLLIYGWAAEHNWHWTIVDIGIAIFGCAVNILMQTLTVYTVDVYTLYSASALAAVGSLRSLAGFGFPLFSEIMYAKYGYGWGNSILALFGLFIGVPSISLLYVYGARIRSKSKFASG